MATPKKKVSKSRRDMRRSHDALSSNAYQECPNCGETEYETEYEYEYDDEEDEDEDEPILHEIKGPDLAVSTRFG